MQGAQNSPGPLRFGVFELDLRARELRKHGMRVRLQEQPLRVLEMLLARPGDVVTREELRNKLWAADTFVDFDHGLNKAVNKIRDALGDSAESPRFVETVARRGYRFLAEVTVPRADETRKTENQPRKRRAPPLAWQAFTAVLVVLLGVLVIWKFRSTSHATPLVESVAVLPLESLSGDPSQDYFADGMTDELITDLGQIRALRVISRTSVMSYKKARKPLPQIGRELGVDAVVEGTVLRSGDEVRITAQLIRAATDQHLWAQSYVGNMRDALGLQTKVAHSIAEQIRISLTPDEEAALTKSKAVNPEAYEAYLKGRYFWNKRTGEGLQRAVEYFNQALAKDPNYAKAYAGLADSYALLGNSDFAILSRQEAYPKAKAAAVRALELDNSLGEAHTSLAFCLGLFEWNWDGAEKEFQKAIALNPGYATAHQWYGMQLSALGRSNQAIAEMRRAESLDPLSLVIGAGVADVLFAARRYDESIEQSRKVIEMDPNFPIAHFELGQALAQKKLYGPAIGELKKARELSGGDATCTAVLASAYSESGRRNEAIELLNELKHSANHQSSYSAHQALVHTSLGEKSEALSCLRRAYEERFDVLVLRSPAFDGLRADPQFRNLVHRIGLD